VSANPGRRERVVGQLEGRELGALVVTHLPSVRYLTGYVGSNGIAVLSPAGTVLLTDGRYSVAAREQVDDGVEVVIGARDLMRETAEAAARLSASGDRVGVESVHMSMAQGERLATLLAETDGGRTISGQAGIVESVRARKDADEVAAIRRAAGVADRAVARVLADGLPGRTERDIAWALLEAFRDEGAEGPSFETIVAAAANGARPHAVPGDTRVPDDTLVVIDLGAVVDGYCSDMTRTAVLGDPGEELLRAYAVCHEAQRAAVAAVRPGIGCAELDAVARDIIDAAGFGEAFGHGLGHGVGLEIHEGPRLGREAPGVLEPGMVVTIEPGIYLEGRGGVRIEDLVVVTDDGCEVLSGAPKDSPVHG
jgi:Xaa-Pro aminopeptidase